MIRFILAHAGNTVRLPWRLSGPPVHPRSRGEHGDPADSAAGATGSSLLTRGTRKQAAAVVLPRRFIPAHAGNTADNAVPTDEDTVHPRSRGEHLNPRSFIMAETGSSPLTRGTLRQLHRNPRTQRFIPAHAGNTFLIQSGESVATVHPRSRGEHIYPVTTEDTSVGSSPLTRGTQPPCDFRMPASRFIPAHAGNTSMAGSRLASRAVHPRSRGEHCCA